MLSWLLMFALSQAWLAVYLLPSCGKKKKDDAPKAPPKYKMTDGAATSPVPTDPKDGKSADERKSGGGGGGGNKASSEDKKGSTDPKKEGAKPVTGSGDKPIGAPVEKAPAPGAVVPALNKDHLVPQVKDAQVTVRPGNDKDKVVSNPIVSAVTEQFPTVAEPPKQQEMPIDKTQGSEQHTDKTQKD